MAKYPSSIEQSNTSRPKVVKVETTEDNVSFGASNTVNDEETVATEFIIYYLMLLYGIIV